MISETFTFQFVSKNSKNEFSSFFGSEYKLSPITSTDTMPVIQSSAYNYDFVDNEEEVIYSDRAN